MRKALVVCMVLLSVVIAQAGEKPLSFQVFPYAGGWFGDEYLGQSWMAGGRLGFAFNEVIGLEAGYEWSPQEFANNVPNLSGRVDATLYHADLLIHFAPSRKLTPYALIGGGDLILDPKDFNDPPNQAVVMWGLGLKYYMTEMIGARIEARQLFIEDDYPLNLVVTAGVQVRFGGRWPTEAPRVAKVVDSDGDTVPDTQDQCPDTPSGATVDSVGCPHDSDNDGVLDGIDKCPDTPAGAKVDKKGCPGDEDGDGVIDGIDKCPGTPKGTKVNALGCSLDSDGDTVPDGVDQCPNTPAGAQVDAKGCMVDSDGDTVADNIDKCPNTPKNTPVDPTGCPEAAAMSDSDGDTVPDDIDKCPNTPKGIMVDAVGCPQLAERTSLQGIKFKTGKSIIDPVSFPILDNVAQALKAHPEMKVEIQGYTDATGKATSNVALSQARAKAVYNYLIKKGVPAKQMTFKGYGPASPIGDNKTAEGRAQNRRIEFKILE